jgi:predicted transcriptional regulator
MESSGTQVPTLPDSLMTEIAKIARAQDRSVSEVLAEAVDRYVKDEQWDALKRYGRKRASEQGLTEADVARLVSEYRKEHGG